MVPYLFTLPPSLGRSLHAAPVRAANHISVPSATEAPCHVPFRSHVAPRDPHESDEDESSRSLHSESMSISDLRLGDASPPSENILSDEPYQDGSHSITRTPRYDIMAPPVTPVSRYGSADHTTRLFTNDPTSHTILFLTLPHQKPLKKTEGILELPNVNFSLQCWVSVDRNP